MNMKRINILMGVAALLALAFGAFYYFKNYMNQDTTSPEITASQDTIECSIEAENTELCEALTATDNRDGDLTSQIMVSGIKVKGSKSNSGDSDDGDDTEAAEVVEDTDNAGNQFDISYIVFDSANNIGSYTRTLVYTDYMSPRFSISDPLTFTSFYDASENLLSYLSANDCIEGDISSQITLILSNEYLANTGTGSFDCAASVTNSLGDTATIPLVIEIYSDDNETAIKRPAIALTDYITYLKQGETFDPNAYLDTVTINALTYTVLNAAETDYTIVDTFNDMDESTDTSKCLRIYENGYVDTEGQLFIFKSSISVNSSVNTSNPGNYIVNYSIADPDTQQTGNANLIVIVQ